MYCTFTCGNPNTIRESTTVQIQHTSPGKVFAKCGGWTSKVSQCGLMETLAVPVSEPPPHGEDAETDQMGDVPVDTSVGGSGGEDVCQTVGSMDDNRPPLTNSIGQLLELPPHVDDATAAVPPEPPDLSPGMAAHKVNGAVVRRVSYPGAAGKHALRQQARRRRRNTSIAAGNSPPITRVTMKTVAATSPNPASQSAQPLATTTSTYTTTTTTVTAVATTVTTTITTIPTTTTTATTTIASVSPPLLHTSVKSPTSTLATTPSPPMCRTGNKMTHSPSQFSGTRLSSKACSSSNLHPVLGTRVSSRIANNVAAATSGAHQHNLSSSVLMGLSQSGAYSNTLSSGSQASRVVRVPVSQSSPSARDASSPSMTTMQTYLAAIPGFKPRKRSQRKLSAAAQLAQTKEGNVDLETPDSILAGVNLRAILNKHTFATLPPAYQHRLIQLLPLVDQAVGPDDALKLVPQGLNNEFFGRACESWRCRLGEGEFTHDNQVKLKVEAEKERTKLDPWKVAHFEPLWGVKQPWCGTDGGEGSVSSPSSPSGDTYPASPPDLSRASPAYTSSFSPAHMQQLTKVIQHIANRDQRRAERRAAKRALREKKIAEELASFSSDVKNSSSLTLSSSSVHSCSSYVPPCLSPGLPSSSSAVPCLSTVFPRSSSPVLSCSSSVLPCSSSVQPCTSSVLPSSLCVVPSSLSVTPSSLSVIPNRSNINTVNSGSHTVFPISDKLPLPSQIMSVDPSGFTKDGLKRKESLPVPTSVPTKKICVSSSELSNYFVAKHSTTPHSAQRLMGHVGTLSDIPRSRVTITPVVGTVRAVASSGSKVLSPPVISQAKTGGSGKPAAMVVVNSLSQSSSGQLPTSPASRTSPLVRVSPAPSPSRLSPVVQVLSPSLPLAPSPSPPVTRTVMVAGHARPVEVSSCVTSIGQGPRVITQTLPSSSVTSVASKIKTVRTLPQSVPGSGTMTVKVTKSRNAGGVNIQRSYEIVQAVIANSPNRDQLQAQLKSPASLLAEVKPATSSSGMTAAVVVSSSSNNNNNSHLVVQAAPQLQTITVVKTVATSSNSCSTPSPVSGAQLMAGSPRTVRQVALSVGGTNTTMAQHTQGGTAAAANSGTFVLRQMMTPQLTTSQVSASSASRPSAFVLDNTPFLACGGGAIRENSALTNIAEANVVVSGQSGLDNNIVSCSGTSSVGSDSVSAGNCGESFNLNGHGGESGTTMVVVSQPTGGTNSNGRVMVLHSGSSGPLLVSIPSESQTPKIQSVPLGPPSTPLSPSPLSPLGVGASNNSQSTSDLTSIPTTAVCLSNTRPLILQPEGCDGSMAPPAASPRPITILRPSSAGKSIVVRMPMSGLQVVRLGNIASINGDCGENNQQQNPPRAASAPPNKSGVMVALSPRPSSVGPRIVVQTTNAQGSPATILTSAGQHFLSEGDPSSGVSSCDSDQLVTTRAGASQPIESSLDSPNSTQSGYHPPVINTSVQRTMNGMGGFGHGVVMSTSSSAVNPSQMPVSGPIMTSQSQPYQHQQPTPQPPLSQHPNMPMRPNMRMMMNNIQHVNNMQSMNNMQPMNNMHQIGPGGSLNGMATVMTPMNQGVHMMLPQGKSDTSEDGCPCNMKAMIICIKCGAFCHHDCIGPARLCVACLIR
ncbi:polycomb protein Asx-like isoform X2 [Homarus americanus]|uniref:polycomb protein Asx-like isoform X2 n=1 Tax=Homarus americanus TaxID=6706 RepID=UPI001C491583|nr:polycomb protein Asx-like isoform X2 [Homarus americanus]